MYIYFNMERYLLAYIDNIARKEGISRSAIIRNIVRGSYGRDINEDQRGGHIYEGGKYKEDMCTTLPR